eukprot:SM000182S03922  [mRNA]  locus=s182:1530:2734:+ [translate_table: standard]
MTRAPQRAQGVAYVPSFALGVLISAPLVTALPFWLAGCSIPLLHANRIAGYGILSGAIYNIAIVCSMLAIPELGYSVAYPIMQCGLFVAGLWGILLFGEIEGCPAMYYWLSGAVLIAGACLLSYAREGG